MRTKEILDKYDTTDQHYTIELKEKISNSSIDWLD